MTPKEYLRQLTDFRERIKRLDDDIKDIQLRRIGLSSIDYGRDPIQTSNDGQGFTRLSDRYLDMLREREIEIQSYKEQCHTIQNQIWRLSKKTHRDLLTRVYVDGVNLKEASKQMNYDYNYIRILHGAALEDFRVTIMEKQERE